MNKPIAIGQWAVVKRSCMNFLASMHVSSTFIAFIVGFFRTASNLDVSPIELLRNRSKALEGIAW
jgi:hypothetical protein